MYCPQCGHSNDDEYAFCKKCGASLERRDAEPAPATRPLAAVTPPPAVAASAAPPAARYRPAAATPAATGQATEYAGFWWRFLAVFIDGIILVIPVNLLAFMFQIVIGLGIAGAGGSEEAVAIVGGLFSMMISVGLNWFYEALMVSSRYQGTLGKMAVGIVVTDLNGGRISFWRATGRCFGKLLSSVILLVGYLMQPFTDRRQALHDMLAGCLVLRKVARPSTV